MRIVQKPKKQKISHGGRNLVILGIVSTVIALVATGVSLLIYHNSGDIYLDRSRPGYLPDEEEIEQNADKEKEEEYEFSKDGVITEKIIDEYLEKLNEEIKGLDAYSAPFDSQVLSDEQLGI